MNTTTVSTNRNGQRHQDEGRQTRPFRHSLLQHVHRLASRRRPGLPYDVGSMRGHAAPRATVSSKFSANSRAAASAASTASRSSASASRPRPVRHLQRLGHKLGDLKEPEPSGQEGLHRHLVGGVEHRRRHAAAAAWPGAPGPGPGSAPRRAARSSGAELDQIDALGRRRHARRPGQAQRQSACACRGSPAAPASSRRDSRPAHG